MVDFSISTRSQIFKESEATVAESPTNEVGHEFGCGGASHNGEKKEDIIKVRVAAQNDTREKKSGCIT